MSSCGKLFVFIGLCEIGKNLNISSSCGSPVSTFQTLGLKNSEISLKEVALEENFFQFHYLKPQLTAARKGSQ